MKEASGELSMTAITVVAIAAIAGIFTTLILPKIRANIITQAKCSSKYNCGECSNGIQACSTISDDGNGVEAINCPCDGE